MSEWTKFEDGHPIESGWYWIYRKVEPTALRITIVRYDDGEGFSHGYGHFPRKEYWHSWMEAEEPVAPE